MTIHDSGGADGLVRRVFTVDDVQRMLEAGILDWDERFELIRGEIVPMLPEISKHAQMKARLARWFGQRIDQALEVGNDITVRLDDGGLFIPDVLVWRAIRERKYIPIAQALFAIEVADTTLKSDLTVKAPDYGRAGLGEMWVVDVNERVTHVHREPFAQGYRSIVPFAFDDTVAPAVLGTPPLRIADLED
jgi:Uma2 family endonuclease